MNLFSIEFQQPTGYCITIHYPLSTINCQLSTINYPLDNHLKSGKICSNYY